MARKGYLRSLPAALLLLAVITGLAVCFAISVHHAGVSMNRMPNCSMTRFASMLLPSQLSDRTAALLMFGFLSVVLFTFLRQVLDFHAGSEGSHGTFLFQPNIIAAFDPIRDIMRRGIIHPKLYNFSFIS